MNVMLLKTSPLPFYFPITNNYNMTEERTCKTGATLAPLKFGVLKLCSHVERVEPKRIPKVNGVYT
jgi:hypothetical protein